MSEEREASLDDLEGGTSTTGSIPDPDLTQRESGDRFQSPPTRGRNRGTSQQGSPSSRMSMRMPEPNPATMEENELYHRNKTKEIEESEIVKASRENPDSLDVFNLIIQTTAEEIAALSYERKRAEKQGRPDVAQHSSRTVTALKSLAESWMSKRKQFLDESLDLKSDRMQNVVKYLLEVVMSTMQEVGIRREQVQQVFEKLMINLDGWEDQAKEYAMSQEQDPAKVKALTGPKIRKIDKEHETY